MLNEILKQSFVIIGVDLNMPVVRDNDNHIYIRQWSGGILSGCFELDGKPCFDEGVPDSFQFQLLPEDWDHCRKIGFFYLGD